MNEKQVKIGNKEYIFAELASNQTWNPDFPLFLTWNLGSNGIISIPYISAFELNTWKENTKIITTTNTITEEIAKNVVEKHVNISYRNYNVDVEDLFIKGWTINWGKITALESFYSLMDSLELDRSKNYLLIEKL